MKIRFFSNLQVWAFTLFLAFLAISCGNEDLTDNPDNPDVPEEVKNQRTVLIYFAADNSLARYADVDLEEIKVGMASLQPEGVHLLAYIDLGDGNARLVEYVVKDGTTTEEVIREYGERNSVGLEETREVFAEVFDNPAYVAESYALVYWSHADGWIPYPVPSSRWMGQDRGDGDKRMNLSDFLSALEGMPHFDFIMFDACFMQSIEVAYALRDYTDYYIASPTETPGTGAPYDRILSAMLTDGAAVELAEAYFETYETNYDGTSPTGDRTEDWTAGAAICVLSTAELEQLASLTNRLLPEETINVEDLHTVCANYDQRPVSSSFYVGYYDWDDMMQTLLDEADYSEWKMLFEEVVNYWATTSTVFLTYDPTFSMEGMSGVSHYVPESLSSPAAETYRSTEWYEAAGLSKLGW